MNIFSLHIWLLFYYFYYTIFIIYLVYYTEILDLWTVAPSYNRFTISSSFFYPLSSPLIHLFGIPLHFWFGIHRILIFSFSVQICSRNCDIIIWTFQYRCENVNVENSRFWDRDKELGSFNFTRTWELASKLKHIIKKTIRITFHINPRLILIEDWYGMWNRFWHILLSI